MWRGKAYCGLQVAGDQTAALTALHTAGKLIWTTSGIPASDLTRFGIHYWTRQNVSYVGLRPPTGSLLMVR